MHGHVHPDVTTRQVDRQGVIACLHIDDDAVGTRNGRNRNKHVARAGFRSTRISRDELSGLMNSNVRAVP